MDQGEAPDVRVLWDKTPTARRVHLCERCGEKISVGERYESTGLVSDGLFEHIKRHLGAFAWPSHCPSIRPKDLAELVADEEFDRRNNPYQQVAGQAQR